MAIKHRLLAMFRFSDSAEVGGLVTHGPTLDDLLRLKGAKPGDLPLEQSTKFEFVMNIKTAKASS